MKREDFSMIRSLLLLMSRAELAEQLGVDVGTVRRWELGERKLSGIARPALASVLSQEFGRVVHSGDLEKFFDRHMSSEYQRWVLGLSDAELIGVVIGTRSVAYDLNARVFALRPNTDEFDGEYVHLLRMEEMQHASELIKCFMCSPGRPSDIRSYESTELEELVLEDTIWRHIFAAFGARALQQETSWMSEFESHYEQTLEGEGEAVREVHI